MDGCVLAIDLGTSGPKVAVIDRGGRALSWANAPVRTTLLTGGGAEQDPNEMWQAIIVACRSAMAVLRPVPPITAVAVTSQYMSTIPVAADGTPTGPCVLWMDTRGAAHSMSLLDDATFMLFVERHGLIPLPSGNDNVAHAWVLRHHHPDAYERSTALVEPMNYVTARLTGRVTATQSTVFGQLVCDNRTWGATEYDADLVAATNLDPDRLAPLVPMWGAIGEVLAGPADELGIPAGIPVVPGTIDSITSAVGSAALDPSSTSVVVGTTAVTVSHIGEQRSDLLNGLLAVPSPLHGMYYAMAENGVGGRALEWAMQLFGYGDPDAACADAATVEAGSAGVAFLPWLLGSLAPSPDEDVRAAFVGLGLEHGRRHAVRAVLEGVALNLAWLQPRFDEFTGHVAPFVRFGGGGAMSSLWAQMLADALDRPVHRLAAPRVTNARGAAFLAFADLGGLDLATVPDLIEVETVHEPDPHHRAVMEAGVARLAALHPTLSGIARQP